MSLTLSKVAEVLIGDGVASSNDGEILTRLVEAGHASRAELDGVVDMVTGSALPDAKKRSALRKMTTFLADTASGVEASVFGIDVGVAGRLSREGVRTCEDYFLYVAANAAERYAFADRIDVEEKALRKLVKQADLQRVDGIDPKLAHALLAVGVDSVPELARRSVSSLRDKLKAFAGTTEGFVMRFAAPTESALAAMKAAAVELPKVVSFGRPDDDLASMSLEQRAELMINEDPLLDQDWNINAETGEAYLASKGLGALTGPYQEHQRQVLDEIVDRLQNAGIDTTVDELLANPSAVFDNDDLHYEFNVHPSVTEFTSNGELVGAKLQWSTDDGSEGEYWSLIYDHVAGKFSAMHYSESANGETWTEIFDGAPAATDLPALRAAGAALADTWSDEAIMDGLAVLKATKAEYGWSNPASTAKSLLTKHFEGDEDHRWDGWVSYHEDYPFTPSALDETARAINNLGFGYANDGEVGRIRAQLADVVAKLGPEDRIQYGTASGKAIVEGVNGGAPVETVAHIFVNKDNGAYVLAIARQGSY